MLRFKFTLTPIFCLHILLGWCALPATDAWAVRIHHAGTGAAFDFWEQQQDPYVLIEEGGALDLAGTVARNWPPGRTGYENFSGVPADVNASFWSDAGRMDLNLFARAASNRLAQPAAEYGNIASILPGTSGLADGDPVTLQLTFRHRGIVSARGGSAFVDVGVGVDVDGLGEGAPTEEGGISGSDSVKYDLSVTYWGPGALLEGSLSWRWTLDKNNVEQAADSLPSEDGVIPALEGSTCLGSGTYQYICGLDREFDTGVQTVTLNTFVGARLWVNASAWATAITWNGDEIAVADLSDPFRVTLTPATGYEGVELAWDIQPLTQDDAAVTDQGAAVTVPVLANDRPGVNLGSVTQGANGAVTANVDGTVTYTPYPGFSGADSFTYTAGPAGNAAVAETATVTVTVNAVTGPAADLTVAIADAPDPVDAGDTFTYTVTVTNQGPEAAANASLGITLPALRAGEGPARVFVPWVEFVSATPSVGTCTESDLVLSCALGDLAAAGTATVQVQVRPLNSGTELTTEAVVASDLADPVLADNTATATTTVTAAADLSVTIADVPDPFEVSGDGNAPFARPVLYTVTVSNNGPDRAQDVVLIASLSDQTGIALAEAVPHAEGTCVVTGERNARCEIASLESGDNLSFNVQAEVTGRYSLECTATAGSTVADPDIANNTAMEETSGALYVDFEIAALDGGALYVGNQQTYRFRLTAAGQSPSLLAFYVPFSFILPQELALVQVSDNAECTQEGQTLDCLTWFQNNSSQIVEVTVEAPGSPGSFELLALIDHDGTNRMRIGDYEVSIERPWYDTAPGNNGVALPVPVVDQVELVATGIEVTQGIQNLANEMPLVADRATVVRGYATTTVRLPGAGALLHGSRDGEALAESPLAPGNPDRVHLKPDGGREDTTHGWWFVLPSAWRSGEVELRLEVDPEEALNDTDRTDNSVSAAVSFQTAAPLNLTVLPVAAQHPNVYGDPLVYTSADPGFVPIIEGVKRFHPVSRINLWESGEPLRPSLGFRWDLRTALGASRLVGRVAEKAFWTTDRADGMHYMGMVHPDLSGMKFAGMARRPGKAGWSKFSYYCKDGGRDVRCGSAADDLWRVPGSATVAHELGHNLGLKHQPCNGEEGHPSDAYPWPAPECGMAPEDEMGYFGTDTLFNRVGIEDYDQPKVLTNKPIADNGDGTATVPPQAGFPLMGYQRPAWVSPWEYCYFLDDKGIPCNWDLAGETVDLTAPAPRVAARPPAGRAVAAAADGPFLVIAGAVDPVARTAVIDSVQQIDELPAGEAVTTFDPADTTGYTVDLLDGAGTVLASYAIPDNMDEADGEIYGFFLVVVAPTGAVEVSVNDGAGSLASVQSSATAPTVALTYPNGGESLAGAVTVQWSGSDADDDTLTYTLLYSPDAGQSWTYVASGIEAESYPLEVPGAIAGSDNALFRVVACDGFLTGEDVSDAVFSTPGKVPVALISQPADGATFAHGEPVFLTGMATDLEDGPLSGGSLTWSSNVDGDLATGDDGLALNLSPGAHTISLRAADSSGLEGLSSVSVTVAASEGPTGTPPTNDSSGGGGGGCFLDCLK